MDTCKFVHYMIDESIDEPDQKSDSEGIGKGGGDSQDKDVPENSSRSLVVADSAFSYERMLYPPQYIKCDLRFFNFSVLGEIMTQGTMDTSVYYFCVQRKLRYRNGRSTVGHPHGVTLRDSV